MMNDAYSFLNRAEFITAGFRFELKPDGSVIFWSDAERLSDGSPGWQAFANLGQCLIWLGAGFSEIESAGLISDLYIKQAAKVARHKP